MPTKRRAFGTAAVVLLLVAAPLPATWSAFSATTADAGNTIAAGTVVLTDDDADTSCIQVTYSGTLGALVRMSGTTTGTGETLYR